MSIFEEMESNVRIYSRFFPAIFSKASGAYLVDDQGECYLDFFCGAGALNYGHNHPELKQALIDYIMADGITHSLDFYTDAKAHFLTQFRDIILKPRQLNYKVQFTGPTGTNSVEAALKLARKVTQRQNIIYFKQAFHGMTMGALSVCGNSIAQQSAGVPLPHTQAVVFDHPNKATHESLALLERQLIAQKEQNNLAAAVIVETIQAEGGINVASDEWLQQLRRLTQKFGVLLIIDDIQAGCGRSGRYFSFETAAIKPDIVCLAKSLSAYGLPCSITLIKPEYDQWQPGEHTGTFRGNNHAFVTASKALQLFWNNANFVKQLEQKSAKLQHALVESLQDFTDSGDIVAIRGKGFIYGIEFADKSLASDVRKSAFDKKLIIENCGEYGHVLKLLPPLIINDQEILQGVNIIKRAITDSLSRSNNAREASRLMPLF